MDNGIRSKHTDKQVTVDEQIGASSYQQLPCQTWELGSRRMALNLGSSQALREHGDSP